MSGKPETAEQFMYAGLRQGRRNIGKRKPVTVVFVANGDRITWYLERGVFFNVPADGLYSIGFWSKRTRSPMLFSVDVGREASVGDSVGLPGGGYRNET